MKRDRHILQKYLDNELSERELERFEQKLNASPDLLVDLDLYKEVDEAIADTEVLDFRAQLTDLREETRRSETGRRVFRFTRPWHYAASAALALLVAIGLATVLGRPLSNNDLFVKYSGFGTRAFQIKGGNHIDDGYRTYDPGTGIILAILALFKPGL